MERSELVQYLINNPDLLKRKKPFTRGSEVPDSLSINQEYVGIGEMVEVGAPSIKQIVIPQEQFRRELDVYCHDVLFNENLPSICVKVKDGDYRDLKFQRTAIPFQKLIKNKQLIHLTANPMEFSLLKENPNEQELTDFITFKQLWEDRNQDGMKTKFADAVLSNGDAGLLYYFDNEGHTKSRVISFEDGFVLCPHNDDNGDRVLESIYYVTENIEHIISYDDKFVYRMSNDMKKDMKVGSDGKKVSNWVLEEKALHGFQEIPLITRRIKDVPWGDVQILIENFEEQYTIFNAIQRRFGWGIFYIKGKFKDRGQNIAGSVVLNDASFDGKGDAKFLTPPSPQGMLEMLEDLFYKIQIGSGTTIILPKDLHLSADISGLAVQLTEELDMQTAQHNAIDMQNVANKMLRLFKYGIAKEQVKNKTQKHAITDCNNLKISAKFKIWRPFNETEYNNMILSLVGGGILSKESGIESNTMSRPDEKNRIKKQIEEESEMGGTLKRMPVNPLSKEPLQKVEK